MRLGRVLDDNDVDVIGAKLRNEPIELSQRCFLLFLRRCLGEALEAI